MPTIHLQVCAGFANRVRALISGICLAEDLELPLIVHWFSMSPECACRFQMVLDSDSLPKTVKVVPEDTYMAQEVLSRDDWEKVYSNWDMKSDVYIKSHGIFYTNAHWNDHLRKLQPSPFVKQIVQRRTATVPWERAMGIHIRRGDNKKSIDGSPLSAFLKKMRKESDAYFVICTDDLGTKELLMVEFGDRSVFPATVLSRKTEEGMIHGVVDFFALTKCRKIWGSVASSFTEIAARYGNTELEVVTNN
jgi:hypothetical protein